MSAMSAQQPRIPHVENYGTPCTQPRQLAQIKISSVQVEAMNNVRIATQPQRLPRARKLEILMASRNLELAARFADPGEHVSQTGRSLTLHGESFQSIAGSMPQPCPLASVQVVRNRNNVGIVRSFRTHEQPALMTQPSQRLEQISSRCFSSSAPIGRVDYQYFHLAAIRRRPWRSKSVQAW